MIYYAIWYLLSRLGLILRVHITLRDNARQGFGGLFGDQQGVVVLGFVPLVGEVGLALGAVVVACVDGWALVGRAHRKIGEFYLNRYGGRRE